ncbi:Hpt domain-containing protein [Roseiflexus sp. AH-315-K22]|nr:Hpt domain-containing protein [Roseiflexus sp. AH-315-K22]
MTPDRPQSDKPKIVSEFADDKEFSDLIELFVSELPDRVAAIESAFEAQNHEEVFRLTHQLKGSGPGYGFPTIGEAAGVVEEWYRERSEPVQAELEDVRKQIDDLVDLCQRATHPTN